MIAMRGYDLVLMDIRMPGVDGYAATRQIRAREHRLGIAEVPIIALTASALEQEVQECLAAGCNVHVSKPLSRTTLLEAISRATIEVEPVVAEKS
jgi:CheY-like chemotaxis protein